MNEVQPTGPMVVTALLSAKPDKREELHQALRSLAEGIQVQPGCLDCLVGQDIWGTPRFNIHLIWEDRPALEVFMSSDVFRILLGAMNVLAAPAAFRIAAFEDAFSPAELNQGKCRPKAAVPPQAPP